jgi:Na+/H+-dicarboxylate symporter
VKLKMKLKMNPHLKTHLLTILTITAVVLGVAIGSIMRASALKDDNDKFNVRTVMYINFLGDVFLRILKALILPLVISSLVSAVGSLDISLSKRIGTRAIAYYLMTTVSAVILGIVLVTVIRPGGDGLQSSSDTGIKTPATRAVTTPDTLLDLVR